MMYDLIDPIILKFTEKYGLKLMTEFKDIEIRGFTLKNQSHVWIEPPNTSGKVQVTLGTVGKSECIGEWFVEPEFLESLLEKCVRIDEGEEK